MKAIATALLLFMIGFCRAASVSGYVTSNDEPVAFAVVGVEGTSLSCVTDTNGFYRISGIQAGNVVLRIQCINYLSRSVNLNLAQDENRRLNIILESSHATADEVVITGTMNETERSESPVPVEVFTPKFFKKNPAASLFESVGMMNGVKPQLNCNVCNTGDIHINGMEGPYTMVLIDGMPIVSSLATVYGLMGIPNSLIERVEVVKGPASSLYGSEAMGGLINVITKNPMTAPRFGIDVWGTSWAEGNADLGFSKRTGKNSYLLTGINAFWYNTPIDNNNDNFTDVTLQKRTSLFAKWAINGKNESRFSLATRYIFEDRWGGEMQWKKEFRGGDSVYGESIYTSRFELIAHADFPWKKKVAADFSYNYHDQNSVYGATTFLARQHTLFGQLRYTEQVKNHFLLGGISVRSIFYDDNTAATFNSVGSVPINDPDVSVLPGIFLQDEWSVKDAHRLLLGVRYNYHLVHGSILSPRIAWKYTMNDAVTLRSSFGTGFRVVNVFTEDHAALTGWREVVFKEELNPEKSLNGNVNIVLRRYRNSWFGGLEITGFGTWFTNKITADLDTDPEKIIYDNLNGYAVSAGVSVNADITYSNGLKLMTGVTWMKVFQNETDSIGNEIRTVQLHAPEWSGTASASYTFPFGLTADFTASWYGPMRLPVFPNDYRPEYSPWFCIANMQLTQKLRSNFEVYGGVKNLLNFIPENPIMRPFDPFDRNINDPVGNPHGYTFDPSYNYAPLQGIRAFLGLRLTIK
jgi:outer membrane receptor for ferrienterochelin and colicins